MPRLLILWLAIAVFAVPVLARASERAVYAKRPEYPIEAKRQHLTGSGIFALYIRPDGRVERIETLQSIGHSALDRAAITAFREWRFYPHRASWTVRVPIRYVDGPVRVDELMRQPPLPGYGMLITVFSGTK